MNSNSNNDFDTPYSSVNKYSLNFSEIDMDANGLKKFVLKRINRGKNAS